MGWHAGNRLWKQTQLYTHILADIAKMGCCNSEFDMYYLLSQRQCHPCSCRRDVTDSEGTYTAPVVTGVNRNTTQHLLSSRASLWHLANAVASSNTVPTTSLNHDQMTLGFPAPGPIQQFCRPACMLMDTNSRLKDTTEAADPPPQRCLRYPDSKHTSVRYRNDIGLNIGPI